jgi:hypothetical protein
MNNEHFQSIYYEIKSFMAEEKIGMIVIYDKKVDT